MIKTTLEPLANYFSKTKTKILEKKLSFCPDTFIDFLKMYLFYSHCSEKGTSHRRG